MNNISDQSRKKLMKRNDESINYGLVLSLKDINDIIKHTNKTLIKRWRIETSTEALEKII